MSLIQFFRILHARRYIMLSALLSCFAVAVVMIQVLPKRYAAHARVMLDVIKPDPVTGQVIGTQFLKAYTRTQIETIKDFQTAERVVDRLGWANNPEIMQQFAQDGDGTDDIRRWLAKQIIAGTDAKLIEASNIMEISFRSTNPDAAKRIVTVIRDVHKEASLSQEQERAAQFADWYTEQTRQAESLVKTSEAERARFAKEHGIVLQADSTDLESSRLKALSGQPAIEFTQPSMPAAAMVGPAQVQLETVTQQLAQAGTNLGPNHPNYQALQRQRIVLESAAARERAAQQVSSPAAGAGAARANAAYERQKEAVVAQSDQIDMINRMTRDIELKRDQLAKVAERASEYRLQANAGQNEIRPMGEAIAPDGAEFPNVPLILTGSIGFGAALGICLSLLIELLGRRIRGQEDLQYAAEAPVFAEITDRGKTNFATIRKIARYLGDRAQPARAMAASAE